MNVSKLKWAFRVSVYVEDSLHDNGKPTDYIRNVS